MHYFWIFVTFLIFHSNGIQKREVVTRYCCACCGETQRHHILSHFHVILRQYNFNCLTSRSFFFFCKKQNKTNKHDILGSTVFVLMHPDLDITVFLSHFGAFLTSLLTFAQQRISESIWCKLQILVDNLQKQVTCSKLIIHSSKASIYVNETASVIKMRSLDTILMNKIVNWLCHVSIMTLYSILSVFSNAKKVRTQ